MQWFYDNDHTLPFIQANEHIHSSHRNVSDLVLPHTAIIFFFHGAMEHIMQHYETITLTSQLPVFLGGTPCIKIKGYDSLCFLHGGYGSPQAADVVETLHALGVKNIVTCGLCGSFQSTITIGEVFIPNRAYSEEGTSHHYTNIDTFSPDMQHLAYAQASFANTFNVHTGKIVTTDAIYRQTSFKEAIWQAKGCCAVDMETSAIFCICEILKISVHTILLVSDQHQQHAKQKWTWGKPHFHAIRIQFIKQILQYVLDKKRYPPN